MFKSIRINNFKGLSNLRIDDASYVNLIGGKNNVGKTSVLEALFLYLDRANPNSIIAIHGRRGFQTLAGTQDILWGPIFKDFDLKNPIEIILESTNNKKCELKININNKFVKQFPQQVNLNGRPQIKTNGYPAPIVSLDLTHKENGQIDQLVHLVIEGGGIMMYTDVRNFKIVDAFFMPSASRTNFQEDAIRFGKLDVKGKLHQLIKFIKETIEPRLTDLSSVALESQSVIHAKLEGIERKIPVSFMGEGMSRLISIILAISSSENGYVFIDEIENGIHYSAIPKMWNGIIKAAEKYNCQIFATTHSYECLEAAIKGIDKSSQDKFRYIRLERENEKIVSNNFSFEELATSIEHEWEVR